MTTLRIDQRSPLHRLVARGPALLLSLLLGLALAACDDDSLTSGEQMAFGPAASVGGGTVRTFVRLQDGQPVELGVAVTEAALTGLPDTHPGTEWVLQLPSQTPVAPFDHVTFGWNPHGHEPEHVYTYPHFDVHFNAISRAAREAIGATGPTDPKFDVLPGAAYVPQGYVRFPGGVPKMGAHWGDPTSPEHNGGDFTKTLLAGSYDGDLIFWEPMLTLDYLDDKGTFTAAVAQPQKYERAGFYPTTYHIRWDGDAKVYLISLGGLQHQPAS